MKILIPTAKEMKVSCSPISREDMKKETKAILHELKKLNVKDLAKFYKINDAKASVEHSRLSKLDSLEEINYPAIYLFDGLMYRNIKRDNLTVAEEQYYRNNVFITSSLYGIVNVYAAVAEHRLDFQQKVNTSLGNLKQIWRPVYDNFIRDEELIISLLSSEFEEVFSKDVRDNFVKIVFLEKNGAELKGHSTISKKARGQFLSCLAANNVTTLAAVKKIEFQDFKYKAEYSEERKLVFVKEK